jgi:hypothetical protein
MTEPKWTTTLPTEPGPYWYRDEESAQPEIMEVHRRKNSSAMWAWQMGNNRPAVIGCDLFGEWWPVRIEAPPK